MLNQKICLVDYTSETPYQSNSVYTQRLSRSQLNILYLATALAVRPNQITVLSERESSSQSQNIIYEPLPLEPERFWLEADFDTVICVDSLQGSQDIKPYLPAKTNLVLWTHLPLEHLAMWPLGQPEMHTHWDAIVCASQFLAQSYINHFKLPVEKMSYFWPATVRTLRKRFTQTAELKQVRNASPTLAFTADPSHGLHHLIEMFTALQQGFADLNLHILLPSDFEEELSDEMTQQTLARCRQQPGIVVKEPVPWPSHVENLLQCHILCHPLAFMDLAGTHLIDALGAGCEMLAIAHPGLQVFNCGEHIIWVEAEPADNYLRRYGQALAERLHQHIQDPEALLEKSIKQIADIQTYFTWDLRVWDWESLCYRLQKSKVLANNAE